MSSHLDPLCDEIDAFSLAFEDCLPELPKPGRGVDPKKLRKLTTVAPVATVPGWNFWVRPMAGIVIPDIYDFEVEYQDHPGEQPS